MVSRGKVGNSQHFPTNLHILLDEAEKANHSDIVCWSSQGQSFKIQDQEALVPLLAKYFRQTKFKSFLRQLQSYGFHRTTRGVGKGTVSHPFFVKGRRSMCFRMTRKPTGSTAAATAVAAAASATPTAPSNAAIPRLISSSSIHRQVSSSCNLVYRMGAALPNNGIQPVQKNHSAPIFHKNASFKNGMTNLNGGFIEVSKLKNETIDFGRVNVEQQESGSCSNLHNNRHHSLNNYLVANISSGIPKRRCSSATAANLYSESSSQNKNNLLPPPMRRTSDPNPNPYPSVISEQQRDSILKYPGSSGINIIKCGDIDYSRVESSAPGRTQIPRESIPVSIKESSAGTASCTSGAAPNQVSSQHQQQQVLFQVQAGQQHHEQMPQALPQDRSRVLQQQQHRLQLQHRIHQLQYQQEQFQVQYQAEQERQQYMGHVKLKEYQLETRHQVQVDQQQHDPKTNPQAEQVYSHQEPFKQAGQDMEKHFRDHYSSTTIQEQNQLYCPNDTPKHRQYRQQEQQQQPRPLQVKVHPYKQVQYHSDPQQPVFVTAPQTHACKHTQKSSDLYEAPLDNFKLSFSTAEFTNGTTGKGNTNATHTMVPSMKASAYVQSHETNAFGNGNTFSIAIFTPATKTLGGGGGLQPPSNGLPSVSTMPPLFGSTGAHKIALQPITTQLDHTPHPRTHTVVSASFSQQQLQQQHVGCPAGGDPVHHQQHRCSSTKAATACDTIDEGTVDFLLQTGSGGCDEWEMRTEEVAEGLNYYGFLNSNYDADNNNTETAELRFSDPPVHLSNQYHHHHFNNPMPVRVGTSSGPPILQSNRQ
jgi:hypothetical protein